MRGQRLEDVVYARSLKTLWSFWDSERAPIPKGSLHLASVGRLLAGLGHPERRLSQVVHIAGTNGKGSVSAFLDALLRAHGWSTFRYTSPHLHTVRERLRKNGEPLSKRAFSAAIEDLYPMLERLRRRGEPPSVFEILTALGLHLAVGAHCAIVEVGLGGRMDATNVFRDAGVPCLPVITRIGLDHTAILGDTLTAIAADKAGILGPGPALCAPQAEEARAALQAVAAEIGAQLEEIPPGTPCDGRVRFRSGDQELTAALGLAGPWQAENAALALAACARLLAGRGQRLDPQRAAAALAGTRWPGRLERLPGEREIVRDGAHNPSALRAVLGELARRAPGAQVIFGCGRGKDAAGMLALLAEAPLEGLVLTRAEHPRAAAPEELAALCPRAATVAPDLRAALAATDPARPTWVLGSLFLGAGLEEALDLPAARDPDTAALEGLPGCRRRLSLALLAEVPAEIRVHPTSTRLFGRWTWDGGELPYAKNHYDLNCITSAKLARDKQACEEVLACEGLPVAGSRLIENPFQTPGQDIPGSLRAALADFGQVVVKPNAGSQGSGVGFFSAMEPLQAHVDRLFAASIYRPVLVQPFYPWRDVRVLILDGRVLACYERRAAALRGDGARTVRELLVEKLERNRRLRKLADLDALLHGPAGDRVLADGERLELSAARSVSLGGRRLAIALDPGWRDVALRAAAALRLRLAGVDLLLEEPTAAPEEAEGIVLEVNSSPALNVEDGLLPLEKSRRTVGLYREVVRALLRSSPARP